MQFIASLINKLEKCIEENLENPLNDLKEFVRIPSIAAKNQGVVEAAEFLRHPKTSNSFRRSAHIGPLRWESI